VLVHHGLLIYLSYIRTPIDGVGCCPDGRGDLQVIELAVSERRNQYQIEEMAHRRKG
jgi:hypothetical protein